MNVDLIDRVRFGSELTQKLVQNKSFQIEIEMKQIMILNDDAFFDNCLIKTQSKKKVSKAVAKDEVIPNTMNLTKDEIVFKEEPLKEEEEEEPLKEHKEPKEEEELLKEEEEPLKEEQKEEPNDLLEIDDLADIDELKEVDNLNLEHVEETVTLKQPNQVYLDLYKKAREKAKAIKREMILSFLEAKHIKESYMIDVYDENEYNIDAEIDAVSEKHLQNV